ncbi:MAG: putative sugar nucleotidyl transferase [Pirellulales bacterium]
MRAIVFEDAAVADLGVLVTARPACDLMIGAITLVEALGRFGAVRRAPRPHLAAYLAALDGRRMAVWGGSSDVSPPPPAASSHGEVLLAVNARVVPSQENLATLRTLVEAGRRCIVRDGISVAAAVLHRGADIDHERLPTTGPEACGILATLDLPEADATLQMLRQLHDVVTAHETTLAGSLAMRLDAGGFTEIRPGLFAAPTARIPEQVIVRGGPVLVADDAEVGPFVCLDGPIWIGPGCRINPHAWIRAGASLGRECRVGGEVEASVLEPFSNKPHDGFVGHSHVGSWVNIAAGTITGNLKASYGQVRLHGVRPDGSRLTIHTGRQFLGALIGDFAKTGINSSIPCGARIGAAATVGGTVPDQVVAFTNQLIGGEAGSRSTPAQAATTLERMMARRGLAMLDADRGLLDSIA